MCWSFSVNSLSCFDFVRSIAEGTGEVDLDFEKVRLDRTEAAVLTAVLLGPLSKRGTRVLSDARWAMRIAHSGLAMALAQPLVFFEDRGLEAALDLKEWRLPWTASSRCVLRPEAMGHERLFEEPLDEGTTAPGIAGRYHGTFVDPHLSGRVGARSPLLSVVESWLYHVLPRTKNPDEVMDVLRVVSTLLHELLANVQEHAPVEGLAALRSAVTISVLQSCGSSIPHVAVTVLDTGPGIISSLACKLIQAGVPKSRFQRAVHAALLGDGTEDSAFLGRGRGLGLSRVRKAVQDAHGTMDLVTEGVAMQWTSSGLYKRGTCPLMRGTVVSARIPVLYAAHDRAHP